MVSEMLLGIIIGGCFAIGTSIVTLYGYYVTQKSKQRYYAWELIFKIKIQNFDRINGMIIDMADFLRYKWEISRIDETKTSPEGLHSLIGWENRLKAKLKLKEIIPDELTNYIQEKLKSGQMIDIETYKIMKHVLMQAVGHQNSEYYFKIHEVKVNILLVINNRKILDGISSIVIWLYKLGDQIQEYDQGKFTEWTEKFQKEQSKLNKLMRKELVDNINEIEPDLTIF